MADNVNNTTINNTSWIDNQEKNTEEQEQKNIANIPKTT